MAVHMTKTQIATAMAAEISAIVSSFSFTFTILLVGAVRGYGLTAVPGTDSARVSLAIRTVERGFRLGERAISPLVELGFADALARRKP
jgi:hypothetical protein